MDEWGWLGGVGGANGGVIVRVGEWVGCRQLMSLYVNDIDEEKYHDYSRHYHNYHNNVM